MNSQQSCNRISTPTLSFLRVLCVLCGECESRVLPQLCPEQQEPPVFAATGAGSQAAATRHRHSSRDGRHRPPARRKPATLPLQRDAAPARRRPRAAARLDARAQSAPPLLRPAAPARASSASPAASALAAAAIRESITGSYLTVRTRAGKRSQAELAPIPRFEPGRPEFWYGRDSPHPEFARVRRVRYGHQPAPSVRF